MWWYWFCKYILMGPLLTFLGRPKVEGLEYVPPSGPVILASNHLAVADSFFLPLVVRRRITFLAKAEYFTGKGVKGRLTKWFYSVSGQVPIDRTNADSAQAALDAAQRILGEGKLLGMYPEGTRSPDGRLYKGKSGLARLALETGVPVIPVAMIGTDVVNPPGSKMLAVRPRDGSVRQADGLLPVRGDGRQPVHRTGRDRRGDVRTHGTVRPGIRRYLRGDGQEVGAGRQGSQAGRIRSAFGPDSGDRRGLTTGAVAVNPATTMTASAHHT